MKTVHELSTNARMDDSRFEYLWPHSWMVVRFAGVVATVGGQREAVYLLLSMPWKMNPIKNNFHHDFPVVVLKAAAA